jgi:hypothetical protein
MQFSNVHLVSKHDFTEMLGQLHVVAACLVQLLLAVQNSVAQVGMS